MRIATRLALVLGATVAAIMAVYALVSQHQREALLRTGLSRETETLADALQIVAGNALRDRRFGDLHRVLGEIVEDPETFVVAVYDPRGRLLAGGADRGTECLAAVLPRGGMPVSAGSGWTVCDGDAVRWAVRPLRAPGAALVLARRATVIGREIRASRLRLLALTAVLALTAALAIRLVLRRSLAAPLAEIQRGIRALGGPAPPAPLRVPRSSGELAHLAAAFDSMAAELHTRQESLAREAEERVALERRLRESESFALIGRLSGGLAHELGSPLNVIGIRAETLLGLPELPPAARRYAEGILEEVDRISRLVQELLHAGRRHGITPVPVDLAEVLRGVAEHAAHHARTAETELQLRFPDHPVVVQGQDTLLRHAVLNLVRNAFQALRAHPGERRVRISLADGADGVRIVVEDTGPGIAEAHLPRVFEPFFTTKEIGEGTGLGLAVSRGIVQEHGGTLRLEPGAGGGVRATISLPPAPEPEPAL